MHRRRFMAVGAFVAALAPFVARAQDDEWELANYLGSLTVLLNMLTWMFDETARLTTNSTEADYIDEQWRVDVLAPFAIASAAQEVIAGLNPPLMFADSHDLLSQSIDNLVTAGDYMNEGVLNLDLTALELATEHMLVANDLVEQANDTLPLSAFVDG
jgi:hypothetical protein